MHDVAEAARSWIGTPFQWEASLKGVGCDCRGLISGAARDVGRPEAQQIEANIVGYAGRVRESVLLAGLNRLFLPRSGAAEPGDILAFRLRRTVQHLAIATDHGRMIHAYFGDPGEVVEVPICSFWRARLAGVWAWKGLSNADT